VRFFVIVPAPVSMCKVRVPAPCRSSCRTVEDFLDRHAGPRPVASCQDCHHNTTMPVVALLPRYAAETPFPEVWGGFRCSAYRSGMSTFGLIGWSAKRWPWWQRLLGR
jgi:hypothetical protein